MFSRRAGWDLTANRLHELAAERRAGGGLLDLTVTNPTRCGFEYPPITLAETTAYQPEPLGLLSAREAVCRYYAERGRRVAPEQLVITASTSEAYSHLFRLLCNAGDAVGMAPPTYPLFEMLAEVDGIRLEADGAKAAKAVLLVHPNNPTGRYVTAAEWQRVQERAARQGAAVIVDEVFFDYELEAGKAVELDWDRCPALTFVLNGLSKISALPQMKMSWIGVHGPRALREEALARLEMINDLYLSAAGPVQAAAEELLGVRRVMQPQIMERLRTNLAAVPEKWKQPVAGGWSAVLKVDLDAERLCERAGVLVHPGHFYGFEDDEHLVVSLLVAAEEFADGIRRIGEEV